MASPPGSITTVSGRRCTRSRARTAATSTSISTSTTQEPAAVNPTEATSSASAEQPPQQQTTTAAPSSAPPPSPPPAESSTTTQAAAVVAPPAQPSSAVPAPPPPSPSPSTADAEATSATGTIISVPTPLSRITPLALASPSPAAASPSPDPASQVPAAASPVPAVVVAAAAASPVPAAASSGQAATSSGPTTASLQRQPEAKATVAAVPSGETSQPPPPPSVVVPAAVAISSDIIPVADPTSLVVTSSPPAPFATPVPSNAPSSVQSNAALPVITGPNPQTSVTDSPALADPNQSSSSRQRSKPTPTPSGGVAGGLIAPSQGDPDYDGPLTLNGGANAGGIIGGVFGGLAALALISVLLFFCLRKRKPKPVRWNEKRQESPKFVTKLKTLPTGMTSIFARMKGNQAGPMSNPYQRHQVQNSVGSIYSRDSNSRARSSSEPQGFINRSGSNRGISSEENEGNGQRKKPSSISFNFRFPGIQEDTGSPNPFADPKPNTLLVLNPDPRSAPVTPRVPAPTVEPETRDPFASILDPPGAEPVWAGVPTHNHQRTMSSFSTLSSNAAGSLYSTYDPFRELSKVPPLPTQVVLSRHTRNRSSVAVPGFDAMSTFASRDSDMYFGEPGPSRRGTNMYTPVTATYRTVRQSDPFDLDRPEVLRFGNRKDSIGNLSRQPSRRTRVSSIGNWPNGGTTTEVATTYGLFPRDGTRQPSSWVPPPMPPVPLQPNGGKI